MTVTPFNPNPIGRNGVDCAVRAICAALGMEWGRAYTALSVEGYAMKDVLTSNAVWGAYLREHGFIKRALPDSCLDGYTVEQFAEDHSAGVYVLALPNHVVCLRDGCLLDTWDSSHEIVLYYFEREE